MTARAVLVLLAALAFASSPFFNPEFGGFDPDRYPVPQISPPVQPAGYAFAIWGVIYIWLVIYAAFGVWRYREDPVWDRTRLPMIASLGVGIFWLPVALVSPVWATVMIVIMLVGALDALFVSRAGGPGWALSLPIGLYAGWLSAATFVALGLLAAGYDWGGPYEVAYLMVGVAAVFALINQRGFERVWTYGFAASWGLLAIAVQNWGNSWGLVALSLCTAGLLLWVVARQMMR